ncbi:MAG TPA: hypothetical protein VG734_25890 [Lacunisphaera sp.]|nr:hypothetical protein [Lacunisphaera sp.]
MPIDPEKDKIGGPKDSVRIEIDGKIVQISEHYRVEVSVLRQPGAMSLRIGSAQTAQELLAAIKPRKSRYKLFINDVLFQSGIIYGRRVPRAASTIVEVKGRDYMSVLYDAYVKEDKDFHEKTYREFVRRVLDEVGLTEAKGHRLITSNDVNRMKLTGRNVRATSHAVDGPAQPKSLTAKEKREAKARAIEEQTRAVTATIQAAIKAQAERDRRDRLEAQEAASAAAAQNIRNIEARRTLAQVADTARFRVNILERTPSAIVQEKKIDSLPTAAAVGSTSTVVVQTLKVKLGTRWIDALERELKLVGLFLWCDAEGNFILARPNADQTPSFRLFRQRGGERYINNIIDCEFDDDTTSRHTSAVCYGRVGKGKAGRNKLHGDFADDELSDSDFDSPLTIHDDDVATNAQAAYIARKAIAEERRSGHKLEYTVRGHTADLITSADGASSNWTVDVVVSVDDREIGIQDDFYLEALVFARSPHVTTELVLMRPKDLVFAEDLFPKPIAVQRLQPKKPDGGVGDPSSLTDEERDALKDPNINGGR